jgi:hypothetical protein
MVLYNISLFFSRVSMYVHTHTHNCAYEEKNQNKYQIAKTSNRLIS